MDRDDLQLAVARRARGLFERVRATTPSVFNRAWWSGKVMDWCMKNEAFKVEMFRFVDVLPYLDSSAAVARHLQEYFCRPERDFPAALQWGISRLSPESMAARIAAKGVKGNIVTMARQFITGATPEDALPNLKRIRKDGLAFTLDLLGEATLSHPEADDYQRRYLELLATLVKEQHRFPALGEGQPELDWGVSPRVNLSIKASSFNPRVHPVNFAGSVAECKRRLLPVYLAAKAAGAFVNLDIEQYAYKDLTLELFKSLLGEPELADYPHLGIVLQAYLRDTERDARDLAAWARDRGTPCTVRLVKGAYWDYETVVARQEGWPVPVFEDKAETDANFEQVAALLLENHRSVRLACASHNLRSIAFVLEYAIGWAFPGRSRSTRCSSAWPSRCASPSRRNGCPCGSTPRWASSSPHGLSGKTAVENTANESFLRQSYAEGRPSTNSSRTQGGASRSPARCLPWRPSRPPSPRAPRPLGPARGAREFPAALARVGADRGRLYPLYIDGQWRETRKRWTP